MIGAIIGDMAGSRFEHHPHRAGIDPLGFPLFTGESRFTDDTVMSIAVSQALMDAAGDPDRLSEACALGFKEYGRRYPAAGYGGHFRQWLASDDMRPLGSFGNGSAMRVSPVGWSCGTLEEAERMAKASADATHNHPEGVKGACSVAAAIFLARQGQSQKEIRRYLQRAYGYDLDKSLDEIGNTGFDVTCQGSVPQAIVCALETSSVEEAVRSAILLRGDADTQGAIAGSIAEALWGVPEDLFAEAARRLDRFLLDGLGRWLAWLGEGQHSLAQ